ncbi:unnamed protein product [Mytilus coruscus]|uniref:KCTD1_15 n=1 Tax=Mytilus coruscus TaxID=42192 RepID=A0A6J8E4Q3_MYTCO|nr:unnamed protein product [Mytilus coruscus]
MATKGKFASLEDEERENLLENVDAKNIKRQTNTALYSFREDLTEKSLPLEFESYEDEQLDDILAKFYMEMRNKNGEMFKKQPCNRIVKVFVDIMIHFGRRGRENLSTLTRKDFAVQPDPEGTLYIYKTHDELTKNLQTNNEKSSDGKMYEIKGN